MFKLRRRGAVFYVHFNDAQGNRQRISTGESTEAAATAKAFEIVQAHLRKGSADAAQAAAPAGPQVFQEVTVAAALQEALAVVWEGQRSLKNRRSHIEELTRDLGYLPLGQLDYDRLVEYGKVLAARGNSPATRNRKMSTLQVAVKHQHDRGRIPFVPKFPTYKEADFKERYLTDEEEARLLAWLRAQEDYRTDYAADLFTFLVETGARATEALTITPEQHLGDAIWFKHGTTKNGRGRSVPLSRRAAEALDRMLASRYHGGRKVDWATRQYRRAADAVGLHDTTLHTLRHTCASRLVQAGVPLYSVMHWLGHSGMNVTQRYAHLAKDQPLHAALEQFERSRAGGVPNSMQPFASA